MNRTFSFSLRPADDIYLVQSDILSTNDNPYILIKQSSSSDMSQSTFYIANHIIEDKFVRINLDTQDIETLDENAPDHMCDQCDTQGGTIPVSGFRVHNKRINVISDDINKPTEAKEEVLHLCEECINKVNAEYQFALDGKEEDLLSHVI